MTDTVKSAIEESIVRDRIVTIDEPTEADIESLMAECDDGIENGLIREYWGTEDGAVWRVHVARGKAMEQ